MQYLLWLYSVEWKLNAHCKPLYLIPNGYFIFSIYNYDLKVYKRKTKHNINCMKKNSIMPFV